LPSQALSPTTCEKSEAIDCPSSLSDQKRKCPASASRSSWLCKQSVNVELQLIALPRLPFQPLASSATKSANHRSSGSPRFQREDSSLPISPSRDRQRRYS